MANEFIIKKGHSSRLSLIAQKDLVENGWYLTTDTAEVYVALRQDNGLLELKKINECNIDTDLDLETFEDRLSALEAQEKLHTYGYRSGFPTEGEEGHMYVAADEQKTYVWFNNDYLVVGSSDNYDVIFGGTAD
jgi:hypothetical protein